MSITEPILRQLLTDGESNTVEFKVNAPRSGELAERMCGMANSRTGGIILFGIADATRDIVGVSKPNETIDTILRATRLVKPVVAPSSEPEVTIIDERPLIVVQIPPNNGTLYQASGVFWIRKGTHTIPMSSEEVAAHLHTSGALRWETALCPQASLADLDDGRLAHYLTFRAERSRQHLQHTSQEELLLGLGCAARDPETGTVRPTNVGVLMFGREPHWRLPQCETVFMRYADDLGIKKFADRQILTGTALELIDTAAELLARSIQVGGEIVGFKRVDMPEYPTEALREAVVNAVTHRDYSLIGEAIRIFMYTDRIEVHSPGLLPPGVSLADLRALQAPSRPRNPILAQFLRDVPGYMERVGAGIRLMVNEMRLLGLPDPEFIEQHEFVVIFRNGRASTVQTGLPLNARQLLGLRIIQEHGSLTSREYVEATGVSERTALRELRDMVERGVIVVRGRTRSARYFLP
jgi:ATP-dependent DNA helicase RecG